MSALHARSAWHAEGLRWLAGLLNGAADALERSDPPPADMVGRCATESCDEIRSRLQSVPYL